MSWARVDDGAWEHPKFEQLRESGNYAAISLWFLSLSYCGKKGNPRVSVREAAMLLCCDEATAQSACDVLRSTGLFDDDSASKQNRSNLIHDWENYRSKDEAKANAGRQGGVKSGESRRSKREAEPKQTRSTGEADAKQSRTPDPDPDPDSVTRLRSLSPGETDRPSTGQQLQAVEARGFKLYGVLSGPSVPILRSLLPITDQEFADASHGPGRSWKYFAKVLTSMREQPAEPPRQASVSPEPRKSSTLEKFANQLGIDTGLGEPLRDEMRAIEALNPTPERLRVTAEAHQSDGDKCGSWQDVIAELRQTRLQAVEAIAP